jgi:hypothetical protein
MRRLCSAYSLRERFSIDKLRRGEDEVKPAAYNRCGATISHAPTLPKAVPVRWAGPGGVPNLAMLPGWSPQAKSHHR